MACISHSRNHHIPARCAVSPRARSSRDRRRYAICWIGNLGGGMAPLPRRRFAPRRPAGRSRPTLYPACLLQTFESWRSVEFTFTLPGRGSPRFSPKSRLLCEMHGRIESVRCQHDDKRSGSYSPSSLSGHLRHLHVPFQVDGSRVATVASTIATGIIRLSIPSTARAAVLQLEMTANGVQR